MLERRTLLDRWASCIALDVRSLALFRITMGAIVLADLANRALDFSAMYADGGLAPISLVRAHLAPGEWSLHLLSRSGAVQAALFILATGFAAALTVGFRTRLATIGTWALVASLHVRLPIVLNAGDTMLRVLLFWSMFLPLGAAWSLDARRRGPPAARSIVSTASLAFVVQLALVYWCAGLSKLNAAWLDGDALGQVFGFAYYGQPLGAWLRQFPQATRWLSLGVVALELAGPCLLFVPWRTRQMRIIAVAAFMAFHLGIAATITVGLFPWVGVAAWLAMIPGPSVVRSVAAGERVRLPPVSKLEGLRAACLLPLLAAVIMWNALDLAGRSSAPRLTAALRPAANATMLRQAWKLFSEPAEYDAWFVYEGRLRSGDAVDLRSGAALTGDDRPAAGRAFPNHRWRKLHLRITQDRCAAYRQPLAEYVCREWNRRHAGDEQAVRLDFYCIRRPVDQNDRGEGLVRINLARVIVDPTEGAFADALRELED